MRKKKWRTRGNKAEKQHFLRKRDRVWTPPGREERENPEVSGEEQEGRGGVGDQVHVLLVVAAEETLGQVVQDAHDAHQEEERDDSLPKQEAWSALARLSLVANEVLLSGE